jgi:hypothetical protein
LIREVAEDLEARDVRRARAGAGARAKACENLCRLEKRTRDGTVRDVD